MSFKSVLLCGLIALISIDESSGSYCATDGDYFSSTYCSEGCCGSSPYEYCCSVNITSAVVATWIIVVAVIGGVIVVGIVIAIVCCFIQTGRRPGQVITNQQMTATNVAIPYGQPQVYYTQPTQPVQPMYPTNQPQQQPPPYST